MAFYRIEPWGEPMHWARHGKLMELIASAFVENPPDWTDFIPDRGL